MFNKNSYNSVKVIWQFYTLFISCQKQFVPFKNLSYCPKINKYFKRYFDVNALFDEFDQMYFLKMTSNENLREFRIFQSI